jgi:NTP pyrophosphatase (non-canonical NTP hydrolase)
MKTPDSPHLTWEQGYDVGYSHAASSGLPARILVMCKARGWRLDWCARGAYLHLEASELIEAIRGKRGSPTHEAADVLIVLMSITEHNGISWADVVARAEQRVAALTDNLEPYPGEHRDPAPNPTGETDHEKR